MYIGIDLGGTNIAAGIVTDDGKILSQGSTPTLSGRPIEEVIADMVTLVNGLIDDYGITVSDIKAIGIGSPGSIDHKNGIVVYSNNLKMNNFHMADALNKAFGVPVKVDNDANCAAMGEYMVNGNGTDNYIFVTLGTGVGGGVIVNGKMLRGFNGAGGEVGHMTLISGGEECTCGRPGCWEAYASVTALIRQTKRAMDSDPNSLMHQIAEKEGKVSGRTAFEAAKAGDKTANEVVDTYRHYVAEGVASLVNIFQPEIIAIGGGISKEGEYLLGPVREYVNKSGYNKYMDKTKIVTAQLFNDAGIIGAAMMAK